MKTNHKDKAMGPTYVLFLQPILVRLGLFTILFYGEHHDKQNCDSDGQQGAGEKGRQWEHSAVVRAICEREANSKENR